MTPNDTGAHRRPPAKINPHGFAFSALVLALFGAVFAVLFLGSLAAEGLSWQSTLFLACTGLFTGTIIAGFALRNRPRETAGPRRVVVDGLPALRFPGDRLGMLAGAALYPLVALLVSSFAHTVLPSWYLALPFDLLALYLVSFTVFAAARRFDEEGITLDHQGVRIHARGLRARLPWDSIASIEPLPSRMFGHPAWALRLKPGSPREVSTTVPWWIGSRRPSTDSVYFSQVQIPSTLPHLDIAVALDLPEVRRRWDQI